MYAGRYAGVLNELAAPIAVAPVGRPAWENGAMLLPAPTYGIASAFTWPAALFLWGRGSWADLHRHHCVQLVIATPRQVLRQGLAARDFHL